MSVNHYEWLFLLNKYPNELIDKQFSGVLLKFGVSEQLTDQNYDSIRTMANSCKDQMKLNVDYEKNLFVHFTYCLNMRTFPHRFHNLWQKYFGESPINEHSTYIRDT